MVTKAELLPNFPQAFVGKLSKVLLLTSVGILTASPGWAVTIGPTSVTVIIPGTAGGADESNNTQVDASTQTYSRPTQTGTQDLTRTVGAAGTYIDDVLLQTITFSGTTFDSTTLSASQRFQVTAGRANLNAEFGQAGTENNYRNGTTTISDTISDNNPNPFVTAGIVAEGTRVSDATQESTVPDTQDAALQAAFDGLSISQGIDGEELTAGQISAGNVQNYTYRTIFDQGVVDSSTTADAVPELIFFERGINSDYTVRAIIGGSLDNPSYASTPVTVLRGNHTSSGILIDTVEISGGQTLGIAGIDLNEFGITTADTAIYGIEFASTGNSGADIYGQFASASNTDNFRTVPTALVVPEPLTILGSGMALGFGALMKRQHSRKRKD